MAKHHEILDINFSNATPWKDDQQNVVITADLGIDVGYKVSMKVELENADKARHEIMSETAYTHDTMRKFVVNHSLLKAGKNTIWVTFKDEIDDKAETEFVHDITVEDRDSFSIKRENAFPDEFHKTGELKINADSGLTLDAKGFEEGVAIPREGITMEGRSKIKSITVHCDDDITGTADIIKKAEYRMDRGDSIIQRIPLDKMKSYDTVLRFQMTNKKGVE